MRENLRYILTLTIICLVTASLLTGVYFLTAPKILEQKTQQERQALNYVLPQAGYFEPVFRAEQISYFRAFRSTQKKELLGYAFRAEAQGYADLIVTMAGMDVQGKITGIKILQQNETPGLGAKINEVLATKTLWQAIKEQFSKKGKLPRLEQEPWFCRQFPGKRIEDLIVTQEASGKNIQAVTGATISSEALTSSVREKAKQILKDEQ